MFYRFYVLFYVVGLSYQCLKTIDNNGSTLPPPTTTTTKATTTSTTTTTTTTTTTPIPCGDTSWILSTHNPPLCFKAFNMPNPAAGSWNEARTMCMNQGAVLAPMRGPEERKAIADATAKLDTTGWPATDYASIYFGMMDVAPSRMVPAAYQWTIDQSILMPGDYMHWSAGEPQRFEQNGDYDKCMAARIKADFLWIDILCPMFGNSGLMVAAVCAKQP